MDKKCQNCYWKIKKLGIRGNYCLSTLGFPDIKLKDTCKNWQSRKLKCPGCQK